MRLLSKTAVFIALTGSSCLAQTTQNAADDSVAKLVASAPAAKPEDVASIDSIIAAIYDAISGPAGTRDWNRSKSLMLPNARLSRSMVNENGKVTVGSWSVEEYIARTTPVFAKQPFYEHLLVNHVDRFGNIAQVFSSYDSRREPSEKPFQRGINSMQLMNDGQRWWVVSILWDIDRPGNPLPANMTGR